MKPPILLNIRKQFPDDLYKDGAPADCRYRISYSVKKQWRNDFFRIVEQNYDAKDAYLGLIEITAQKRLSLIISTTVPDLFWLYQQKGNIKIRQYPTGTSVS